MNNLDEFILKGIEAARTTQPISEEIYHNKTAKHGENDMLFFFKPEITNSSEKIQYQSIYQMILGKIKEFGFVINNVRAINAGFLKKHNIIAQHYGVINSIARDVKNYISDKAIAAFGNTFGEPFHTANVFGGLELMKHKPNLCETEIMDIWLKGENKKLGSGTYCVDCEIDSEKLYLFNGFHPAQLKHFIAPQRTIVTLHLTGNCPWPKARQDFIGATNPASANKGSIRNNLFENKEKYGLQDVSYSLNGVHLSAGPVEGLIELMRYNSSHTKSSADNIHNYRFKQTLKETFGNSVYNLITGNPTIDYDGKQISIFDLTEEVDSTEAIEILKKVDWNSIQSKV